MGNARGFLERLMWAAVNAAQPERVVPGYLPEPPAGRTLVLGAGKAAAAMARTVDAHWNGPLSGLVVTRYGQAVDCARIEVVEAAHPVPDAVGVRTAQRILELAGELNGDDLALCLVSGGASALLSLPGGAISLAEKQELNRQLLRCGASISEINTVRRHLSAIKGGRLAAACHPARVVSLLISDVPGDDPQLIGSGPTLAGDSSAADARAVIERYHLPVAESIRQFLLSEEAHTPARDEPGFEKDESHIIAAPQLSLLAAAEQARSEGVDALILSDRIEGESREVGKTLADIARRVKVHGQPIKPPCVLLSGGETTVTLRGDGRGGPNTELGLALAQALAGESGVSALACDTDGIDGSEDNAGCVIDDSTLDRALERGLAPAAFLDNNDAWSFFDSLGDLVVTGATDTNVNDFRAIYIADPRHAPGDGS